jgi:hypothetical protein
MHQNLYVRPQVLKVKSDTGRPLEQVSLLLCVHYVHKILCKFLMSWGAIPPLFNEAAVLGSVSCPRRVRLNLCLFLFTHDLVGGRQYEK